MSAKRELPEFNVSGIGAGLLSDYQTLSGIRDELVDADNQVRPHWRAFLHAIETLGSSELQHRFAAADRHLRDSGVYYRLYHDAVGAERSWPLSHVPLILGSGEWSALEAAVIERVAVLETFLQDCYGVGKLVSEGIVPAAIIAGSQEFMRPLVGTTPAGQAHLRLYAVDLGRAPDGQWRILQDRAQAPSGAGYALENRIALARALPDVYRSLEVERLAPFFQSFRAELATHARQAETRICLLTPGPMNETYFEHAYLARYLGFLLVEGEDLTVRGDALYVRTVSGLKRAEVILRRIDADYADPLELNARSRLGVPGLLRVVQKGAVVLANSLGAGLIESPGLMGYMPAIGRRILGRDLALPSSATWWCGDPKSCDYVIEHLDTLSIAPAFTTMPVVGATSVASIIAANLDREARRSLIAALRAQGKDFIGQEIVRLSTMPAWANGQLQPRPFIVRIFVAKTGDGYTVMPGGFCRVSDGTDPRAVSMQFGGRSADIWVSSEGPVNATSLLPAPDRVAIRRLIGTLPSRAADNLFWLGRYLERAEATLRILRALLGRVTEAEGAQGLVAQQLLQMLESWGAVTPEQPRTAPGLIVGHVLHRRDSTGSLPSLVLAARGAASVIRDRFSPDAWRAINTLVALLDDRKLAVTTEAEAFERTNQALQIIAAFSGLAQENMNRLNGWRFLEIGRRIERGIATCRFVRRLAFSDTIAETLDALLELGDSQITYRLRYIMVPARAPVIDLLVLDAHNPRSVAFQTEQIGSHLARLPSNSSDGRLSASESVVTLLLAELKTADAEILASHDIQRFEDTLMRISDDMVLRYFTHRELPSPSWEESCYAVRDSSADRM
jgi:uncharacterized circularly permuted ATP-grasp superfamily protein/uncharacterized alpha-E superfamily protein